MKISTINKALVVEYILGFILVFLGASMGQTIYNTLGAILMIVGFGVIMAVSLLCSITLDPNYGWLKIMKNAKVERVED